MTHLATSPTDDPDQLALIADDWTTTRKPFADAFEAACRADAERHDGWVNPNHVRSLLIAEFGEDGYNPRQLSALWSKASSRDGFLTTHRDVLVPIAGAGSRGNGGKSVPMRRWRA